MGCAALCNYAEPKTFLVFLTAREEWGTFRNDLAISQSYLDHESLHVTKFRAFLSL
jgi:hypothetical protein